MGNHKSQVSFHSFDNVNLPIEKFIQWEYLGNRKVHLDVPSYSARLNSFLEVLLYYMGY